MVFMQGFGIGALNHNMEDGDKINAGYNAPSPGSTPENAINISSGVTVTAKMPARFIAAPWMLDAKSQLGMRETTGNNDGPDVVKYLKTVGLKPGAKSYWCGAFVNWTMNQAGINGRPENPDRALNWRNFGLSLNKTAYGSVGTLKRKGGGHVGFLVANDQDRPGWVIMLGGNQSDAVMYNSFPLRIMQFNYPTGYIPSYNLSSLSGIRKEIRMQ